MLSKMGFKNYDKFSDSREYSKHYAISLNSVMSSFPVNAFKPP